jgi:hypothetical protein
MAFGGNETQEYTMLIEQLKTRFMTELQVNRMYVRLAGSYLKKPLICYTELRVCVAEIRTRKAGVRTRKRGTWPSR